LYFPSRKARRRTALDDDGRGWVNERVVVMSDEFARLFFFACMFISGGGEGATVVVVVVVVGGCCCCWLYCALHQCKYKYVDFLFFSRVS